MQTIFPFYPYLFTKSFIAVQIHVFSNYSSFGYWEFSFCSQCWGGSQGLMCGDKQCQLNSTKASRAPTVGSCAPLVHPYCVSFLLFNISLFSSTTRYSKHILSISSLALEPAMSIGALVPWYYSPRSGHKMCSLLRLLLLDSTKKANQFCELSQV